MAKRRPESRPAGARAPAEPVLDPAYLLETFLANTPDHVYFKDTDGRFTLVSSALARWLGLDDVREVLGRSDVDFFAAAHADAARASELEVMRTGEPIVSLEERELWPDGQVSWVSTTKVPLSTPDGRVIGMFGLARDITARKLAEERSQQQARELERLAAKLEQLTLHDDLTGLYNLRGLQMLGGAAVETAVRAGSPVCVLFMDLDDLKAINDGSGHAAGDAALIAVAGVLRDTVRNIDVVARIGGDEFVAVLVGPSAVEAGDLCERLSRGMPSPAPGEHAQSVSIGVAALRPDGPRTLDDLIAAADADMYDARHRRRAAGTAAARTRGPRITS